jgi:acyl-CoA reductase-like NAD-dependent aldehyde dehydrogenase
MRTMLVFNSLIDGEWISDGVRSPNINPSDTNDLVGETMRGTRAQANAAVAAAKAAFYCSNDQKTWCRS